MNRYILNITFKNKDISGIVESCKTLKEAIYNLSIIDNTVDKVIIYDKANNKTIWSSSYINIITLPKLDGKKYIPKRQGDTKAWNNGRSIDLN